MKARNRNWLDCSIPTLDAESGGEDLFREVMGAVCRREPIHTKFLRTLGQMSGAACDPDQMLAEMRLFIFLIWDSSRL
jgi:hypothetical protein